MSDNVIQSYPDMEESSEKSKQPHKSAWVAHWMRSSCGSASPDDLEVDYRSKHSGQLIMPEAEGKSSKLVKGSRERAKNRLTGFMDESLTPSSKKLRSEMVGFPFLSASHNRGSVLVPKNEETSRYNEGVLTSNIGLNSGINVSLSRNENCLPSMPVQAASGTETQSRGSHFQREGIVWNQKQDVGPSKLVEESDLAVSRHLQGNFVGSTSEIVQYEFNGGRTPFQPLFGSQDHNYRSDATFLVPQKRMDNNAVLSIRDASTSSKWQRDVAITGEQSQRVKDHSEIQLFHGCINRPEMSKMEKLYHGSHGIPGMPSAVHDVESMRIYTTIDSVHGFSQRPPFPKFSQTTHHLLITKKTEVNLTGGGQIFGSLPMPSSFKGKTVSEVLTVSPHFRSNVKQGVKLQPLDSSTESEGKGITDTVKTSAVKLNNESSADTDTMEMDAFKENHLTVSSLNLVAGLALSPSNKDVKGSKSVPTSEASIPSNKEETGGKLKTELPDINQDLPLHQDAPNSEGDQDTSTSRTQSLDVDHFLTHAEHPTNLRSITSPDVTFRVDPCSSWVKRLKPSDPNSFCYGTEMSRMEEAPSHEKVNKFFSKMLECKRNSSETKMVKSRGQEPILANETTELTRNPGSSSSSSERRSEDVTLTHAWIQRWCHNQSAFQKGKLESAVACGPSSSKGVQVVQKKQFPSIAAMALMGKAMTGFHPCKFRKKGSSVVWNAKE
ncbi:hypothetical protein Tsubulata_037142 [Turnera subulata]|uniref:F-box protein n=1 Tax=Turnera subulata TaxID=218843 RepID=A0A9Q0GKF7_9ROSI|nr:hypothetical protein Tsubulata_037142 [Turnera subulata]